jgi:hypothetical protein
VQSPEDIVKNFCAHESTQEYMDFVDWSTPENSLNTIHTLRQRIDNYHGLRRNFVRYGANLGRHASYFDNKMDEYRKQLIDSLMVSEKSYQVSNTIAKYGHEYGINSNDFEVFSGNKMQHHFHERIVRSLDQSFSIPSSELKTLSIGSLKCAYTANKTRKHSLVESCLNFTDSLLYLAKRAGSGVLAGGIDFKCAVAYLLGEGEIPRDTSSVSEIFAKIKEQPLKGVGDGLEYAVRTLTFGGAVFISYLLGLEVAAAGVAATKGIVAATQFLKPFSVGISPDGVATLESSLSGVKDFVQASVVTLGQAAQGICGVAEQCGHLFAAANGGGPGRGGENKLDWTIVNKRGETRSQHVMKHDHNNLQKKRHGVFKGDSIKTTNSAWKQRAGIKPITKDGLDFYIIPYLNAGFEGGYAGQGNVLNNVTIITEAGTSKIITSFPSGSGLPPVY